MIRTTMKESSGRKYIILFIVVSLLMIVLLYLYGISLVEDEHRGSFGDMFGGFTALMSTLTFAGMIITLLMQSRELTESRKQYEKMANAQNDSQLALNSANRLAALKILYEGQKGNEGKDIINQLIHIESMEYFLNDDKRNYFQPSIVQGTPEHFYDSKVRGSYHLFLMNRSFTLILKKVLCPQWTSLEASNEASRDGVFHVNSPNEPDSDKLTIIFDVTHKFLKLDFEISVEAEYVKGQIELKYNGFDTTFNEVSSHISLDAKRRISKYEKEGIHTVG